ncbi:uncharacterized protein LOC135835544 isoform X2 [Planococcus citri]|uniref:uncharacterized protein LOC135835544 isoform X2 n=1 Tax=Planococcus citri TaxID=170843 RepID=UPI0031F8F953
MADRHRRDDDDRKSRRDEDRYHRSKAQKRSRSDSRSRHRRHRSSEEREIDIEAETRRMNEIQANIERQRQRDRLESERRGGPQQANYFSHRPVIRRSDGKPQPRPPYNAETLPRPPDHNCYNCSNPDHYDFECPKWEDGPRCFRCSEWGHFGTTCNNPRVFYKHEFAKYRDSSRDNRIRDTVNGAAQLISGERQPEDFMGIPRFDRDARNDIEENRRRHQSSSRYRSPNRDEQHRSRSSPPRETDKSSRSATDRDATQTENRRQSSSTHSSASGPSPPPGRGRSMARPEGARRLRNFPAMLVDPHIEEESPYTSFLLMELPDIDVNSLNGTQAGLIYNHIAKWEQMLAWFRT